MANDLTYGDFGEENWGDYDFSGGSSMPNATVITSYDKPGEDYGTTELSGEEIGRAHV